MRRLSNCLCYTGSKFRFLSEIEGEYPSDHDIKFLDLFGGGGDITVNSPFKNTSYNEINAYVSGWIATMTNVGYSQILSNLMVIKDKYNLSSFNKEGYLKLRDDFNKMELMDFKKLCYFYMLVCHSNSNIIRFSKKKGHWNVPFGDRTFSRESQHKLRYACDRLSSLKPEVLCKDFRQIDFSEYELIYADPPYRLSTASYNESGGWTNEIDDELLDMLHNYSNNGGKFILSNQIYTKGVKNKVLSEFIDKGSFKVITIKSNYDNCNYQRSIGRTDEVIVKNF